MTSPVLNVAGLTMSYRSRTGGGDRQRVLHGVGLTIDAGEVVALVGESGSGKSTVARLVSRLETPDGGAIRVNGDDCLTSEPKKASLGYRARVQMIFQDPFASLNPVHRIGYQLARPLEIHGKATGDAARTQVLTLLDEVGLSPAAQFIDRYPHELSGGQRQRVAIARALAVEPQLILADEPTSMLDVATRLGVLELLERLASERGIAILLITHDLASAKQLADRVLVMYAGRIVESGPTDDVLRQPSHPYTQTLLAALPNGDRSFRTPLDRVGVPVPPSRDGCPFAGRCTHATDRCRLEAPATHHTTHARHSAACHLFDSSNPV